MERRRLRALSLGVALASAGAASGVVVASGGHHVRVETVEGLPEGYFPALTTDALGRPIYSVTIGDIFDASTLRRVTVVRHLDGGWHLLDLPGAQPKPLRFIPTLGLFDGEATIDPARAMALSARELARPATTLAGTPVDLLSPSTDATRWSTSLGVIAANEEGFVDEASGALLATYPKTARKDGADVPLMSALGSAADGSGHLYVTGRDGFGDDALGYLFVHFPGDAPDAWVQAPGTFSRVSLPLDDGSGHVWLANTGPLRDIVVD